MKGYAVITSDEKKAGHVVEEQGDYLIVEHGAVAQAPQPAAAGVRAHGRGGADRSRDRSERRPPRGAGARRRRDDRAPHGLAWDNPDPGTPDAGDILPSDTVEPADDSVVADRALMRERMQPGEGANDKSSSIGITGGDRFRDAQRP
jgi:hypothetical protein